MATEDVTVTTWIELENIMLAFQNVAAIFDAIKFCFKGGHSHSYTHRRVSWSK